MADVNRLIAMLQSPKDSRRFDACEELRVALSLPPDAIAALERATNDLDPSVRDAAARALAIHKTSWKPSSEPSDRVVSPTTRGMRARGPVLVLVGLTLLAPSIIAAVLVDPQDVKFITISGSVVLFYRGIPALGIVLAVSGLALGLSDWRKAHQ